MTNVSRKINTLNFEVKNAAKNNPKILLNKIVR